MRVTFVFGALLLGLLNAQASWPTYTSFGPKFSFDENNYYTIGGLTSPAPFRIASQFTAEQSGRLSARAWTYSYVSGTVGALYSLYEDDDGTVGAPIQQVLFGTTNTAPHIHWSLGPGGGFDTLIVVGNKYWVELSAFDDGLSRFYHAGNGRTSLIAVSSDDGVSYDYTEGAPEPAFQVNVVPEPGTWIVLALGAALMTRKRRAKK